MLADSLQQKPILDRKGAAAAIMDDATFATTLHVICLVQYGEEIYTLDPLELYARLAEDFGATISEENENKLQAILLATSTDSFYEDIRAFQAVCNTLINGDPGAESFDELTVTEIFWGLWECDLNHGEDSVSPEIERLIAREINEEADDSNDILGMRPNYVLREMAEMRRDLRQQLISIGINKPELPPVSAL